MPGKSQVLPDNLHGLGGSEDKTTSTGHTLVKSSFQPSAPKSADAGPAGLPALPAPVPPPGARAGKMSNKSRQALVDLEEATDHALGAAGLPSGAVAAPGESDMTALRRELAALRTKIDSSEESAARAALASVQALVRQEVAAAATQHDDIMSIASTVPMNPRSPDGMSSEVPPDSASTFGGSPTQPAVSNARAAQFNTALLLLKQMHEAARHAGDIGLASQARLEELVVLQKDYDDYTAKILKDEPDCSLEEIEEEMNDNEDWVQTRQGQKDRLHSTAEGVLDRYGVDITRPVGVWVKTVSNNMKATHGNLMLTVNNAVLEEASRRDVFDNFGAAFMEEAYSAGGMAQEVAEQLSGTPLIQTVKALLTTMAKVRGRSQAADRKL